MQATPNGPDLTSRGNSALTTIARKMIASLLSLFTMTSNAWTKLFSLNMSRNALAKLFSFNMSRDALAKMFFLNTSRRVFTSGTSVFTVLLAMSLGFVLFENVASAHVVVYPREATQGSYEKFTVRVPTEKESPTLKVEVKIPDGVTISRFEPKPDWSYELVKDNSDKIISVIWTAQGAGLSATEFGEFNMQGKISDDASDLVWRAYQTYGDGEVVEWVGAVDSDKPASVTKVLDQSAPAAVNSLESSTDAAGVSALDRYLSIAAVVISVLALLIALLRKPQKS